MADNAMDKGASGATALRSRSRLLPLRRLPRVAGFLAILGALSLHHCPIIEVHMSDITRREAFPRHSYISLKADRMICGKGQQGYVEAIDDIAARIIA